MARRLAATCGLFLLFSAPEQRACAAGDTTLGVGSARGLRLGAEPHALGPQGGERSGEERRLNGVATKEQDAARGTDSVNPGLPSALHGAAAGKKATLPPPGYGVRFTGFRTAPSPQSGRRVISWQRKLFSSAALVGIRLESLFPST
jgi:hypothetical protein